MRFVYENELSARPPIIRAGVVGMARRLGWGPTLEPIVFRRGHTDPAVEALYGEYMSDINDALRYAESVVCVRPECGEYAFCEFGRARYRGSGGNMLTLAVRESDGGYEVAVYVMGRCVASQTAADASGLVDDGYVVYDKGGELFATAGMPFSGGSDGSPDAEMIAKATDLIDGVSVIAGGSGTDDEDAAIAARIGELRRRGGRAIAICGLNSSPPEAIGVFGVNDGTAVTAGMLASCPFNQTLSGVSVDGVSTVTAEEARRIASSGGLSFVMRRGRPTLYCDVTEKLRISDEIKSRVKALFDERYCGCASAGADGTRRLSDEIRAELSAFGRKYGVLIPETLSVTSTADGGDVSVLIEAAMPVRTRATGVYMDGGESA